VQDDIRDARDRLRIAMAAWPDVDPHTRAFLASVRWRVGRCVELVYGQRLTQQQAAWRLCISPTTVGRDLAEAYQCYARMTNDTHRKS